MQEINLYHLLKFYISKWKLVLALTIAGLAVGLCYNVFIQVPMYKSSATLILINPVDKTAATDVTLINNYIELFKSRRVLEPVVAGHKLNMTYDDLVSSTNVVNTKSTAVIDVSITSKDSLTSQSLVDSAVASFKSQSKLLYSDDNIQVVDNASLETKPYNVNQVMQLALSTAVGFIISVIALFFAYDYKQNKKTVTKKAQPASTKKVAKVSLKKAASKKVAKKK
ncbi:MAG: Wzz/FepE/Etk N-terminal domain-containing protein [Candidatus Saccharibacteria bacterium]